MSQNTYTNAEKLLEAADQLAQSGECEEEEIYQAARDLELRMQVRHTKKQSAGGSRGFFLLILKGSGIKTDLIKTEQRVKTTKQSQKFLPVCLKNEVKLSECFQLQGRPLEKICFLFFCFFEEFFWVFLKHGIKSRGEAKWAAVQACKQSDIIIIIIMCLQAFIQRVEQRKLLLDLAVSFYTHTKEVSHKHTCIYTHTCMRACSHTPLLTWCATRSSHLFPA